jgi:16S rRNA (cytidine1402-2'-O)-methyltransferase
MSRGTLYVVATPLGHLGDLSPRAAETLRGVDVVAAEDTRRTRRLLTAIDAHPRVVSYHAHSAPGRTALLLAELAEGRSVALATDAGTPGISDPGMALVQAARNAGTSVVPIPGPTAVATALSAAGLPGDRYLFLGFLPRKGASRRLLLERAAAAPWSIVFFEAPGRLAELLDDLARVCGADRQAVVAREMTKLHEEFRGGTLAELHGYFAGNPPRGEVTVVVAGRHEAPDASDELVDPDEVTALIRERLDAGDSRKDIVRAVATRFGLPRNDAYRWVVMST